MNEDPNPTAAEAATESPPLPRVISSGQTEAGHCCHTIRFRPDGQPCSAVARGAGFKSGELVMVQTDHGLEPAIVHGVVLPCPQRPEAERLGRHFIIRRANREETDRYQRLLEREKEGFGVCQRLIESHALPMKLIRVERYFNGGKVIFYFTAETRVDFRELVKDLVQEFRTRVEIRQVGVRHETKMIGGLGCCGRELCCSSYISEFAPVSIKMAKEQGLPLNPAKISGICNRLLCCLTYEYETYHALRKKMPKPGKTITVGEKTYKIIKVNALEETIEVATPDGQERNVVLTKEQWSQCRPAAPPPPPQPAPTDGQPRRKRPRNPNPERGQKS
ncbi:MAG: PSP1 domain-containing protein [Thermodesulfobacteriota bacterium]